MHLTCSISFSLGYDPVRYVLIMSTILQIQKWCMEGLLPKVMESGLGLGVRWQTEMKHYHIKQSWTLEFKPQLFM